MKDLRAHTPWAVALAALFLSIASLGGCADDRDVLDPKTRYACSGQAECVADFRCVQGWCTPLSALADTGGDSQSSADTGGPTVDATSSTDSANVAKQDTEPAPADTSDDCSQGKPANPCVASTWQGCPCGQGCYYYDDATKDPVCKGHGNKGLNDPCDPKTGLTSCAKHNGKPLLCDGLDKKCYLLCDTTKSGQCPAGHKCFGLEDPNKVKWPNNTGICAP